jgi:cytosine/adenosine deaminase-related metal-dependent hydrolase
MSPELDAALFAADELLLVPDHLMLRDGPAAGHAVHVAGGRFRDVGPADALARHPHLTPLPLPGKLLMPGMIDAHHHLTQSFGKSLAYGEPSEIFRRVWVPLESSLDDEFVYLASKLAALESLRGGFTTVCDAGTRAPGDIGAVAAAVQEAGLRCVLGLICNDGGNDSSAADREAIRRTPHASCGSGRTRRWCIPRSPSRCPRPPPTRCSPACRRCAPRRAPSSRRMSTSTSRRSSARWCSAASGRSNCWRSWARSARRC